jgi:hypothetical protein
MSEFQRRTFQNACYRNDVAHPKPVVEEHAEKHDESPPAQPERPDPIGMEDIPSGFQLHWPRLFRFVARLKRALKS